MPFGSDQTVRRALVKVYTSVPRATNSQRRKWRNGILAQAVAPALERGLTPQAIAHCLTSPAVAGNLDDAAELQQPLIPPARDGLTALAIDTRLGGACRDCGRTAVDADQTCLTRGRCDWCHEQSVPANVPSVEELEAALSTVSLSMTDSALTTLRPGPLSTFTGRSDGGSQEARRASFPRHHATSRSAEDSRAEAMAHSTPRMSPLPDHRETAGA